MLRFDYYEKEIEKILGLLIKDKKNLGEECFSNKNCLSQKCKLHPEFSRIKFCTEVCNNNEDCSSKYCNNGFCFNKNNIYGSYGISCKDQNQCDNYTCKENPNELGKKYCSISCVKNAGLCSENSSCIYPKEENKTMTTFMLKNFNPQAFGSCFPKDKTIKQESSKPQDGGCILNIVYRNQKFNNMVFAYLFLFFLLLNRNKIKDIRA